MHAVDRRPAPQYLRLHIPLRDVLHGSLTYRRMCDTWELQLTGGFLLLVASTPSTGCDALCVQVLGGHPPGDRVRAAASLCTGDVYALT